MIQYKEEKNIDGNGFEYITVTNDENKVRIYTLKNGLQVYLAQNFDAPRIQTYIAVRTGSNNDPSDNTGLSHYLEHMMFKGTSKIGTLNWKKESELLNQISDLFEQHKNTKDTMSKKDIYKRIDTLSQEASAFAIPNEYDKCITASGATGTNAHTWLDETVYKNNIPSNEIERWLKVEKERFSEIVLRLFHTELESVYEEFNRAQDHDGRLVNNKMMEMLFPTHPNGQQTTLGKAEHLKNPSMKAIVEYYQQYYVPNNYAMVLVGDLEFNSTIQLINQYFGSLEYRKLPAKKTFKENPIQEIRKTVVNSPTTPRLHMAWRTDSYGTEEAILADVVTHILSNKGESGLLDLHINNAQKALYASAYSVPLKKYGYISCVIVPKENQTLDEAKNLLLAEIENIKKGNFPDWLIPAIVNDFKVQRIKGLETADGLATNIYQTYIREQSWKEELEELDRYDQIQKDDVISFANQFFKNNYVAVYKEKGINDELLRVDPPEITPIPINREAQSDFLKLLLLEETKEIQPEFIKYKEQISTFTLSNKCVHYVRNNYNSISQLHYIFPFGTDHDIEFSLALEVLQYLGTHTFSPDELKQEFYKIGVSYDFKITSDKIQISLSALDENLIKGVKLLHHWMDDVKSNEDIYQSLVETILESREAAKKDKNKIMQALQQYAKYGENSRFRNVIPKERLLEISCEEMTIKASSLFSYPYEIFYYGNQQDEVFPQIESFIKAQELEVPPRITYAEPPMSQSVYFTNYDMVQVEMSQIGKTDLVDVSNFGKTSVFNEYFGSGLSSIVFQEIRESKSLAYSAYVIYQSAAESLRSDYVVSYIGTQPEKLSIAVETLNGLMKNMPLVTSQFENAKESALKKIASGRITRTQIFFNHQRLKKLGVDYDLREKMFTEIQNLTLQDLNNFYQDKLKNITYNTAIIGKKENLQMDVISKLGNFKELTLEDLFGF